MKVKFWCDNGANIHSKRTEVFSLEDLGVEEDEWASLTEEQKHEYVRDWAMERFDFGFEELESK